jgi:nicotinamidase/pyrazinamidase
MRRFVIVVDTQADFMRPNGALSVAGADALAPAMQDWLAALRPADTVGILFTFDTHSEDSYPGSAEAEEFPPHCLRGTPGWNNVLDASAIDPAIPVYRLEKGVFDMWAEPRLEVEALADGDKTDRDLFFARLKAEGVDRVTVIGVAADYCVRWAVAGLVALGFAVELPAALTRGIARSIDEVVAAEFAGAPVRLEQAE